MLHWVYRTDPKSGRELVRSVVDTVSSEFGVPLVGTRARAGDLLFFAIGGEDVQPRTERIHGCGRITHILTAEDAEPGLRIIRPVELSERLSRPDGLIAGVDAVFYKDPLSWSWPEPQVPTDGRLLGAGAGEAGPLLGSEVKDLFARLLRWFPDARKPDAPVPIDHVLETINDLGRPKRKKAVAKRKKVAKRRRAMK